jgi:hypothetical protein
VVEPEQDQETDLAPALLIGAVVGEEMEPEATADQEVVASSSSRYLIPTQLHLVVESPVI